MAQTLYLKSIKGTKGDVQYLKEGLQSGTISIIDTVTVDGTSALYLRDGAYEWVIAQWFDRFDLMPAGFYVTDWFAEGDHYFSPPAVESIRSIADQWIRERTVSRETELLLDIKLILVMED